MDQSDDIFVPGLSQALLDALDRLHPERCPDTSDTDREIWVKVGQRKVVRFLHEQFKRQLTG